jgi:hypothetical protein
VLPPGIPQVFVPARGAGAVAYAPALLGFGRVHLESPKHGVAQVVEANRLAPISDSGTVDWLAAGEFDVPEGDLGDEPDSAATFAALPARAQKKESFAKWEKDFADALYRGVRIDLLRSPRLDAISKAGESERDFRIRLADLWREARDEERARLEARYAPKLQQLEERERRALARVEQEKQQVSTKKLETAISMGATVLGALFGRRKLSTTTLGRAASTARSASRTMKEARDVGLAEETVEAVRARRAELEAEIQGAVAELVSGFDAATEALETVPVRPRKADVEVRRVVLAWLPSEKSR